MNGLPPGLRAAPLTLDDAAEATGVWRAVAVRDGGEIVGLAVLHGARHVSCQGVSERDRAAAALLPAGCDEHVGVHVARTCTEYAKAL